MTFPEDFKAQYCDETLSGRKIFELCSRFEEGLMSVNDYIGAIQALVKHWYKCISVAGDCIEKLIYFLLL